MTENPDPTPPTPGPHDVRLEEKAIVLEAVTAGAAVVSAAASVYAARKPPPQDPPATAPPEIELPPGVDRD